MRPKTIRVNQILNTRPYLFGLPANIVIPLMLVLVLTLFVWMLFRVPPLMCIFVFGVFSGSYFFVFGQEWWRLAAKFFKPPWWVRSNIQIILFDVRRHYESKR